MARVPPEFLHCYEKEMRSDLDGLSRLFALEHDEIEVLTIMPNPEFGSHPKAMGGRREYLGLRRIQRFKVRENRSYLFIK